MEYIDVTFRDGGHQLGFQWEPNFVKKYLDALQRSSFKPDFLELGYWKQAGKYNGRFYHCDEDLVKEYKRTYPGQRFSVMIDYHYCSHSIDDYPARGHEGSFDLIRLCSRSDDIAFAAQFGRELKEKTGAQLSLNFFNITNYTESELDDAIHAGTKAKADIIYFADTHGNLDLGLEKQRYSEFCNRITRAGIKPGMHLHNHSGRAYWNFRNLSLVGFKSTDYSFGGVGKGSGNLSLEHIVRPSHILPVLDLKADLDALLTMPSGPFGLLTAEMSCADHYAIQAQEQNVSIEVFYGFLTSLTRNQRDVYDANLLLNYVTDNK